MKWLGLSVLLLGMFLGGFGAAFFFHEHPLTSLAAAVASDEEYIESEVSDAPLYEEHPAASTTTPIENTETPLIGTASATSSPRSIKIPVMVYHSVRPHMPGESKIQDVYDVTPELLESELAYITAHGYTPVTFRDVVASFDHGTALPPKPIILSFDDGWKNEIGRAHV